MNIFKLMKTPIPADCLPQKPFLMETSFFDLDPRLPENTALIGARLDSMENDFEVWTVEQDARFERAMKRIKLCAFLRGSRTVFAPNEALGHYDWCPAEEWSVDYFNTLDFPDPKVINKN